MVITDNIRRLREQAGLTQEGMAELLKMSRTNYAYLENRGDKLTVEQLRNIAGALGVSLGELLGVEGKGGAEEGERVKELEKRVRELEETVALYRQSKQAQERAFEPLLLSLMELLNNVLIETALQKNLLNSKNTKGWLEIVEEGDELKWYFDDDNDLDFHFFIFEDILITKFLSESEIQTLFSFILEDLIENSLDYLIDYGYIKDPIFISAYKKYEAKKLRNIGYRRDKKKGLVEIKRKNSR